MVPIAIPTNQSFLKTWYVWTHGKVARHFKRDKERIPDTVQNVRLRLLSKDFIGRWFFKHLREELVTPTDASLILGGADLLHLKVPLVVGSRVRNGFSEDALFRIQDILNHARFDYERYYYSAQGHTIDSDKVLRLIGGEPGQYTLLQSLWRQNRLVPAEFTEHCCNKAVDCPECAKGKASLHGRKLTLAHDWTTEAGAAGAAKMRWNDAQLKPFLRDWRKTNTVKRPPEFIMRESKTPGIDAGLLRYAEMIIDNEVVNDFKRLTRHDDVANMVLNNAKAPELSDGEAVAWESDENGENSVLVVRDPSSRAKFTEFDVGHDVLRLARASNLTREELLAVAYLDRGDSSVSECSHLLGIPASQVQKLRASALQKMREAEMRPESVDLLVDDICSRHHVSRSELFGPALFGPPVLARTDLFSTLNERGMSIGDIAFRFGISEERVQAAINRAASRGARTASTSPLSSVRASD